MPKHVDDEKFVLVQGGQRVSDLMDTEPQALAEAAKRRKLAESSGQADKQPPIEIKKNLLG